MARAIDKHDVQRYMIIAVVHWPGVLVGYRAGGEKLRARMVGQTGVAGRDQLFNGSRARVVQCKENTVGKHGVCF